MASIINAATSGGLVTSADTSGVLQLQTASTTAVTVDASQNVGIGTASPLAKLTVINTSDANKQIVFTDNALYYGSVGHNSSTGLNEYRTEPTGGHGFFIGTSGTANLTINSAGNTFSSGNIGIGGTTPTTSGTGITFPATQSASSNANTLDDYEEGTWTPTVTFGGASVGITYNTTYTGATYTKIGNRVCITGFVLLTAKGSSTGNAFIGNLPFTTEAGATRYLGATVGGSAFTFANQFWGTIGPASNSIGFSESLENGVTSSLTNSDFTNSTELYFSATYTV